MQIHTTRSILKISELNAEAALLLQSAFPLLWVEGELSNLSRPSSGHLYFSLKDNKAQVRCAMFKHKNMRLRLKPKNGLKVLAQVKVGLYEARGEFQLIVEQLEDAGEGQLQKAFEALKKTLDAQGLFEHSHKNPLPETPRRIGIITSPTGAAIQDVIHVLKRRCPHIPLLIYPVAVQGKQAATEIVKAIQQANHNPLCDILLLVRGGGSIEDLWSFNEESVAQAIYQSEIPIVSGIGHEIDFTIADFVSDQRAPTPSAAAELVSPDKEALLLNIKKLESNLHNIISKNIEHRAQLLANLTHRLKQPSGLEKIRQLTQHVDVLELRLKRAFQQSLQQRESDLRHLSQRLIAQSPAHRLDIQQTAVATLKNRLQIAMSSKLEHYAQKLHTLSSQLHSISPLATLQRGYSITRTHAKDPNKGKIIHSVKHIKKDQKLNIMLADGSFDAKVTTTRLST